MNWKASLPAALLVAISGLAVGAAIGGKTKTRLVSVTVTQTTQAAPASTTETSTTPTTTTATTSTSTSSSGSETSTDVAEVNAPQQFLDGYIAAQGDEKLNRDATSVSLDDSSSQQQLQGKTYDHAVAFDIGYISEGATASFQLPTPGFSRLTSKAVGLETNTKANVDYHLTVYKNNDSSPDSVILYQASFHGPSEIHKMDFRTQGATDVLFVWAKRSVSAGEGPNVFIMADPVLIGGS